MSIFVNRTLNLKRVKAIGFDMDYTLVRYHTEKFEEFAYQAALNKLFEVKSYPKEILGLKFNFKQVIQGLVIDRKRGNLLKLSRFGQVKAAYHGTAPMAFSEQQALYKRLVIDLNDPDIQSLDTNFSISNGVLFGQLVDLKEQGVKLPNFAMLADDIREIVDLIHRDGTLKREVKDNIKKYIVQDPDIPRALERLKKYDKKLLVITNSDFAYSKMLLDYAITPFLKDHKCWSELLDIVITFSMKPRFFTDGAHFLKIDPQTGLMSNAEGPIYSGIYQGGNAKDLQRDLNLAGDEILYLGDHIYGDVVSLKKTFNWRTGLVLEPLAEEVESLIKTTALQKEIESLMEDKEKLELQLNHLYAEEHELKKEVDKKQVGQVFDKIEQINAHISQKIKEYQSSFNPFWGELMRAGHEESRFAGQVEKYACIYMTKVSDLVNVSPRTYFRPGKRVLPHERV